MRLEDFVLTAAWEALPYSIQVAISHIWLSEQQSDGISGARLLWTTTKVAEAASAVQPKLAQRSGDH
jgi:hypothetical protein